jgi:flagellin-like hook-associated protein FlgL
MAYSIGTYDSTTQTVPVTFDLNGRTYVRSIQSVLDNGTTYNAVATDLIVQKLVSGQIYRSEIEDSLVGGRLNPTKWTRLGAIYKFIINGAGLVTIDTLLRDKVTISTSVTSFSATGTETIQYYVFNTNVGYIRATLTGTATAELV